MGVATQPFWSEHVSAVHGFPSLQVSAAPATHAPPLQASPTVQTEPSASQDLPSLNAVTVHAPDSGTHTLWLHVESPLASHVTMLPGLIAHVAFPGLDLSQNSVPLHVFPSS